MTACNQNDTPSNNDQNFNGNPSCEHTFSDWTTEKQANCKEEGLLTRTCTKCSHKEETKISKTDIHTEVIDAAVSSTCTSTGLTEGKHCGVCGTTLVAQSVASMLTHSYSAATCTIPETCVCGSTRGSALGHDWTEATYTAPKTCLTCGTTEGTAKASYTEGLLYGSCMWGDGYSVWGIGTATDADIIIPDTYDGKPVIEINENAFIDCQNIRSVSIPTSVLEIGNSAFSGCTSLEMVSISSGLTSIYSKAFYDCDSLEQISIPDSIEMISRDSFENCDNLKYNIFDNGLYLGDQDNPYFVLISANPCEQLTINSETEIIAHNALRGNIHIKNVIISDSVRYIGRYAFMGCTNLSNITFGNGLERIYIYAFKDCKSLKSAVFAPNHTWGVSKYGYNTSRTPIETDNDSLNAKNLTDKYCDYWWGNEFAP